MSPSAGYNRTVAGVGNNGGTIGVLLIVIVLIGFGSAPVPASALVAQSGSSVAFRIKSSNGYSILALGGSRGSDGRGAISLFVARKGANVVYSAPATITPTTVEADLGELGSISLGFKPSGIEKTVRSACGGEPVTYESGSYVGAIEFQGEGGFTEASVASTPMLVKPILDLACGRSVSGELFGRRLPGAKLRVGSRSRRHRLSVQLNANRPGARATFQASLGEFRRGVRIERSVSGRFRGSAFDFDRRLLAATVRPPAPFSGRAIFRRDAPAARRWRGNLAIDFPGKSNVPLAARGLSASLVHAGRTRVTHRH
jgi:hypothetical protein